MSSRQLDTHLTSARRRSPDNCEGSESTAEITALGSAALCLPFDLRICKLVLFGALCGCAVDAIVMAAGASLQDPFAQPSLLFEKSTATFAEKLSRSSASRNAFDAGSSRQAPQPPHVLPVAVDVAHIPSLRLSVNIQGPQKRLETFLHENCVERLKPSTA